MRVELDRGWSECGDYVSGTASWDGPKTPRSVRVTLQYRTEGRGNTDKADVTEVQLHADNQGYQQFQLKVPSQGPVSFDGNLISLIWEVELRLDLKGRRDPTESERLEIMPKSV
jgi:hypothetical protein